jgi:hypothetical protein
MLATYRSIGLRRGARLAALALSLALAACGKSPAEKLDQALQATTTWAATAEWIGGVWARGEVPAHFAERSLETAEETLADEEKGLAELPPAGRAALGARLRSLGTALRAARTAVSRGDRRAIAQPLARIAGDVRALRAMSAEARPAP